MIQMTKKILLAVSFSFMLFASISLIRPTEAHAGFGSFFSWVWNGTKWVLRRGRGGVDEVIEVTTKFKNTFDDISSIKVTDDFYQSVDEAYEAHEAVTETVINQALEDANLPTMPIGPRVPRPEGPGPVSGPRAHPKPYVSDTPEVTQNGLDDFLKWYKESNGG